ncbi:MAG: hypothetical protein Q8P81_00285 [Nanoarchaeota archaeon]|nr:hypothetical protein [Nanoarchaeota archaeon]
MFGKTKCKRCDNNVSSKYNFCPYCKTSLKENSKEDFGLLGKNDFEPYEEIGLPKGINMIINSLLKNLGRQMGELERKNNSGRPKPKNRGIGISIHTSGNRPPEIKLTSFNEEPEVEEQEERKKKLKLPVASQKKFSGLPKKNPETNIRRLSDKIIYEIDLPGVESIEDISMIQLENSIEIKARAKDSVFHKIIPISLPIRDYNFSKKKFTLELDVQD